MFFAAQVADVRTGTTAKHNQEKGSERTQPKDELSEIGHLFIHFVLVVAKLAANVPLHVFDFVNDYSGVFGTVVDDYVPIGVRHGGL